MRPDQQKDRELLEQLCALRRLYQMKSAYDSEPGMTVLGAEAYGEALLCYAHSRGAWLRQSA
ncbi:MAG: hypothetical protein ABJB65_07530 [Chloroflexota bacterium]